MQLAENETKRKPHSNETPRRAGARREPHNRLQSEKRQKKRLEPDRRGEKRSKNSGLSRNAFE